jgi:hypothetical protein
MTLDERRVRQQWKAALAATEECLSLEELSRHAERSPGDQGKDRVSSHLSSCPRCQTELAMLQEFERATPRPDEAAAVSVIAAELKRRSGSRMGRLVTRKIFAPRRIGTAAMALAAMLLLIAGGLYLRSEKEPVLVSDGSSGQTLLRSQAMTLLEPKGDLERSPTELRWQAVPGAVRYSVKLMEVDRAVLWQSSSEQTSVALPQPVREKIIPAKTLLWEVTAIEAGGKAVATSPVERFRVPIKAHP